MRKPPVEWDEPYILSLPLGEDDSLERKGSRLLDLTLPGVRDDSVRDELAKQLSAFANTGGGSLLYGLTDDGKVDQGGVSQIIRGRTPTKAWLEDMIPRLTDYEIVGVNAYEVSPRGGNSQIGAGKALYVMDIPDSDRAPHQSTRDLRYYVRLGGRSLPASHKLIEDIRNRARHPNVSLHAQAEQVTISHFSRSSSTRVTALFNILIRFTLSNGGRVKALNTCLLTEIMPSLSFAPSYDTSVVGLRLQSGQRHYWEIQHPLYPEMETSFVVLLSANAFFQADSIRDWLLETDSRQLAEIALSWKVFADSSPPKSGVLTMRAIGLTQKVAEELRQSAGWRSLGPPFSPS